MIFVKISGKGPPDPRSSIQINKHCVSVCAHFSAYDIIIDEWASSQQVIFYSIFPWERYFSVEEKIKTIFNIHWYYKQNSIQFLFFWF